MRVGVVGLGVMGGAIAARLASNGFKITGFDIEAGRREELDRAGGKPAGSLGELAGASELILVSLPSEAAFEDVAISPDGLCASILAGTLVVDTSTLPIALKLRAREVLSEKGATLLDCPLSGTGDQARTGDVVVFSSGRAEEVVRCTPVLEAFSRSHHYVGEFGAGSRMKFVANLLVAIHNVAAAEAMMLARSCGLDLEQTLEVITDSAATSRMWEVRGPKMVEDEYEPGIRLSLFEKDLRIISTFARDCGSPAPLLAESVRLYEQALMAGDGELDSAVVFRRYMQMGDDGR